MSLIQDLEKEGFDTSQITPDLVKQLEQEGFDTSPLHDTPATNVPKELTQNPLQTLGEKTQTAFNQAGENVSQNLASGVSVTRNPIREALPPPFNLTGALQPTPGKGMKTSPELAAGIGTAIQMVPEAITSIPPGMGLGKAAASKAGEFANVIKAAGTEESKLAAKTMLREKAPQAAVKAQEYSARLAQGVQDTIAMFRQRLKQLPIQFQQKGEKLLQMKQVAGKAMGAAEDAAGFGFKTSSEFEKAVKSPDKLRDVAEIMVKWGNKTAKELASEVDPKTIQLFRKLAQEAGDNISNLGNASMQQGREVAAGALSELDPAFKATRTQFLEISDAIKELPKNLASKKAMYGNAITRAQNELKEMAIEAKKLQQAAKSADKEELMILQRKADELIKLGIKHDKLISKIKGSILAATGAGAAVAGVKRFGGTGG